jgi:uncharacterized protein
MLKDRIDKDYIEAMKAKDEGRVSTLRMLRAAVKNAEIDKMKKFEDDADVESVIRTELKKLREALEIATNAGRAELAEKAEAEIKTLIAYLPEQLDEASVRAIVAEKIKEIEKANPSARLGAGDLGRVTGEVMKVLKGKADGGMVAKVIKETLAGK